MSHLPNQADNNSVIKKSLEHTIERQELSRESLIQLYREFLDSPLDLSQGFIQCIESKIQQAIAYETALVQYAETHLHANAAESIVNKANQAIESLNINSIDTALGVLEEIYSRLYDLNQPETIATGKVLVPPNSEKGGMRKVNAEKPTKFQEPKTQDRLFELNQLLITLGLEYIIYEGDVEDNMIRQNPYYAIDIPNKSRTILICDEVGNRTFVLNSEKLSEVEFLEAGDENIAIRLAKLTKDELKKRIQENPGLGIHFVYSKKTYTKQLLQYITGEKELTIGTIEKERAESNSIENLPEADKDGVYTDPETGYQYIGESKITEIYGISSSVLRDKFNEYQDKGIMFRCKKTITRFVYCLTLLLKNEDFQRRSEKYKSSRSVPKTNVMDIFEHNGKQYVSAYYLMNKYRINSSTLEKKFKRFENSEIHFRSGSNLITTSYCLTELLLEQEFQEKILEMEKFGNLPVADSEGIYTHENHKYVSLGWLYQRYKIQYATIRRHFGKHIYTDIIFRSNKGSVNESVCLTDLLLDERFQKMVADSAARQILPLASLDGIYIYEDKNYVSSNWIYEKYRILIKRIKYFDRYSENERPFVYRNVIIYNSYCLTDLMQDQEFITLVKNNELTQNQISHTLSE